MQINYYPWNTQNLIDWLSSEQAKYDSLERLSEALNISSLTLWKWKRHQLFEITLDHINALAKYRNWDVTGVVQWLEINSFHLEDLRKAS